MTFRKEIKGLASVIDKQLSGEKLGSFLQQLDDLEYRIYLSINQLLNEKFDPRKPLSEQMVSRYLKEHNDLLIEIGVLRDSSLLQYSELSKQEKFIVWQNYVSNEIKSKKAPNKSDNILSSVQERFETFEVLTNLLKFKASEKLHSNLFSDLFRLMKFESGYHLLVKIKGHLESGKTIELFQGEDYVAQLVPENPSNAFAVQTDESREIVKGLTDFNLDTLKASYIKDKNNSVRDNESLLSKVDIFIPFTRNMEIILGHSNNGKIVYSISPSYRALFHELAHAHHALKGTHKRKYELPKQLGIFFSRNAEELWTIYLGKTSERSLSKDDKLPTRLTHASFTLFESKEQMVASADPEQIARAEMKIFSRKVQAEILSANKKFSHTKFGGKNTPKVDRLEMDLGYQHGAFIFEKGCATIFAHNSKISKSIFNGSDLSESRFVSSELKSSSFNKTILHNVTIKLSTLNSSMFDDALIHQANIEDNNFEVTSFKKTKILSSTITKSTFAGATFKKTRIENTVFENVDFSEATFNDVIFTNVTFKNCNFSHISAVKMKMLDCHFENVSFESARVRESEISGELNELAELNTTNADMITCNFSSYHSQNL
ncbi:pentapeptide repeat-containing protein [Legionella brunensis]|uniref:Pentapeptide repeats (8 copies) n=1 Tax=Legionella brunensis TaxID=29422 RepID=A0A0W0S0K3_9GAMM|nr:pentapeptide repeat-containing protein [Legionella brunensis]KTC76859.1 Pentapeptide repeats (8 copies) [Legionella brunensis]